MSTEQQRQAWRELDAARTPGKWGRSHNVDMPADPDDPEQWSGEYAYRQGRGEGIWSHVVGDTDCESGWCGGLSGYPKPCPCGGLIHADFGDENWDGDYWLHTKCDRCGLNEWDAAHA